MPLKSRVAVALALAAACGAAAAQEEGGGWWRDLLGWGVADGPPPAPPVDELPLPVPSPGPPQCGSATDCNSEFLEKIQILREELTATKAALKEAADTKSFAAAAEHQAKEVELTASLAELKKGLAELKKARAAACGPDGLPQPADDMRAVAMRAWEVRIAALLAPLEPAINTTLAIVHHGLSLAVAEGSMQIHIVPFPPAAEPPALAVDYSVALLGSLPDSATSRPRWLCQVPVGKGLTEEHVAKYHAESPQKVEGCSEEQLQFYAATFDGDAQHAAEDLWRVLLSPVGRLSLSWRLREAGYAARVGLNSNFGRELQQYNPRYMAHVPSPISSVWVSISDQNSGNSGDHQQQFARSKTFVEFVEAVVPRLSDLAGAQTHEPMLELALQTAVGSRTGFEEAIKVLDEGWVAARDAELAGE
eukprot:COSAG04_NODE_983_length_9008_cov_3.566955_2_plen_420_part_00